jgi:glutamate racemase
MRGLTRHPHGDRLDVTVLGCTHFPLVKTELAAACPQMRFVDGAAGIARRIVHLTEGQKWPEGDPEGIFVTTGALVDVETLRPALTGYGLTQIKSL